MADTRRSDARERIMCAAYELFSQRGIRSVGVDELIAHSGVANATFYRHFHSKDDLARAFLARREQLWTLGTVVSHSVPDGGSPIKQLLGIFDGFDSWFHKANYEGDPFVTVLLEMGPEHPLGGAALEHLDTVRGVVRELAEQAGLRDPEDFARSWQILMKGAIITARMGDLDAARRAREMGQWLIDHFQPNEQTKPVGYRRVSEPSNRSELSYQSAAPNENTAPRPLPALHVSRTTSVGDLSGRQPRQDG